MGKKSLKMVQKKKEEANDSRERRRRKEENKKRKRKKEERGRLRKSLSPVASEIALCRRNDSVIYSAYVF